MSTTIELRCEANPRRLFAKMKQDGERPRYVDDGTLLEFACKDCRNTAREQGLQVERVLHRFNILGELVSTEQVLEG